MSVDLCYRCRPVDFRYAPLATDVAWRCNMSRRAMNGLMQRTNAFLLDHLVGAAAQRERNRDAECFGSFEVDYELYLRRPMDR